MSRSHPDQWTIRTDIARPDPQLIAEFRQYPTTQIADAGGPISVLGPGLVPLTSSVDMCGSAVTLWTKPGDILFVLKAPDLIRDGDILVIDGGGRTDAAVIGDIIGGQVRARGAAGLIVDGAVRDIDGLRELGLPTLARGSHPATGSKDGPGALNVPIACGSGQVNPGDIIRADASGILAIPLPAAEEVLARTREVAAREEEWRAALADGTPAGRAFGVDDLIAQLSGRDATVPLP